MEENLNKELIKNIALKMDTFLKSMEDNNNTFKEKINLLNDNLISKIDNTNDRTNNLENKIKKIEINKHFKEDNKEIEIKRINNSREDKKILKMIQKKYLIILPIIKKGKSY